MILFFLGKAVIAFATLPLVFMIDSLRVVGLLMRFNPSTILELMSSLVPAFHASLAKLEQGPPSVQASYPFFLY